MLLFFIALTLPLRCFQRARPIVQQQFHFAAGRDIPHAQSKDPAAIGISGERVLAVKAKEYVKAAHSAGAGEGTHDNLDPRLRG